MRGARWIIAEAVLAVIAVGAGWIIPDGLNFLAARLGQQTLTVTATERLLAAMVVFMFTVSLQLVIAVRSETKSLRDDLPIAVERVLLAKTATAVDDTLLRLMIDGLDASPMSLVHTRRLIRSMVATLARANIHLRDAHAIVLERAVSDASRKVEHLTSDGLEADIADHLEVTRRIADGASTYLQIQRRAFLVPDEWTQEWIRFTKQLAASGTNCEYIVVLDKASAVADIRKLESMDRLLTDHGWTFRVCDLRDVLDSFGGVLPTEWNLEVINNEVVKLHEIPGRYQGGIMPRMLLFDLAQKSDLRRYIKSVRDYAQPLLTIQHVARAKSKEG
jgi:hypothetical protein